MISYNRALHALPERLSYLESERLTGLEAREDIGTFCNALPLERIPCHRSYGFSLRIDDETVLRLQIRYTPELSLEAWISDDSHSTLPHLLATRTVWEGTSCTLDASGHWLAYHVSQATIRPDRYAPQLLAPAYA